MGGKGRQRVFLAVLLVAVIAAVVAGFYYDPAVRELVLEARGDDWKESGNRALMGTISRYGDWPYLMGIGLVGVAIAARLRRRDWVRILVAAMIASTLTGILANCSRLTTGRVRPDDERKVGAGFYGLYRDGEILVGNSKYNSFPSGHTATAFGFAAPIFFARPVWGIFAVAGAALITCSRVMLGRHHFSDTVVSILLAMFVGWFVLRWVERRGPATWQAIRQWIAKKQQAYRQRADA